MYWQLVYSVPRVQWKSARASKRAVLQKKRNTVIVQDATSDLRHHSFSLPVIHKLVMTYAAEDDPFDSLLTLEDEFYKEGFDLGVSDGTRAGLIEGRFFGLERGFDKYASMGKLYGRAIVWTRRYPVTGDTLVPDAQDGGAVDTETHTKNLAVQESNRGSVQPELTGRTRITELPTNMRLAKHIRTLYALTEPESLSTANDEISVSEFNDRLNRAEGKIKIIEKLTSETSSREGFRQPTSIPYGSETKDVKVKGDGSIEDISNLHARY